MKKILLFYESIFFLGDVKYSYSFFTDDGNEFNALVTNVRTNRIVLDSQNSTVYLWNPTVWRNKMRQNEGKP